MSGLKLTPRTRLYPTQHPSKYGHDDERFQLTLKNVFGTTTSSVNGFDHNPVRHTFAYCAGPAVIVSEIQHELVIHQRLYRARPNASPIHATSSFYNPATPPTTPTRTRISSPLRDPSYVNSLNGKVDYGPDNSGSSKVQNRVREATCLAMCGKSDLLAIGETGYNPRVLLFSMTPEAPTDVPLTILTDHNFGIDAVALSHDSRWLCSLGNCFDGFLLLYAINPKNGAAKLHSSNKCSNVNAVIWMGDSIVSYGTRHVKVWRIEKAASPRKAHSGIDAAAASNASPGPKILSGRNVILGSLISAVFTSAFAVANNQLILGTTKGDICLLDDSDKTQRLDIVARTQFAIRCICYDEDQDLLWAAGDAQCLQSFLLHQLQKQRSTECAPLSPQTSLSQNTRTIAIGKVRDSLIVVNSDRTVDLKSPAPNQPSGDQYATTKSLAAHASPVLGVLSMRHWSISEHVDFLTYSAQGTALLWLFDGTCIGRINVPLQEVADEAGLDRNELKAMVALETGETLVAGDKMGILQMMDRSGSSLSTIQAHSGDVNSIAVARTESHDLICTCGRDRTLQLFRVVGQQIMLIQTLEDHAASVTDAKFHDHAYTLISISSDRTILIRKAARGDAGALAFLPVRVITLKASPISFTLVPFEENVIVVSTMDRQVQKIDTLTGRLMRAFKPSDPLSNDSVLLSCLQVTAIDAPEGQSRVILGVSSTDKSIRLHHYETGTLLAREYGQAAVLTARIFRESTEANSLCRILSCGYDGTVVVWRLDPAPMQRFDSPCNSPGRLDSPSRQTPNSMQPLRKTLTKSEIADFQKTLDETHGDTLTPIRSPSPSRVRKKASRYSLASRASTSMNAQLGKRRTSQNNSPQNASPQNTVKPMPRPRPSLDHRRRSKSAANLNDLGVSADHLSESLRIFRKRFESSVGDKLQANARKELHSELELTLRAMADGDSQTPSIPPITHETDSEAFDRYLVSMIDQRLALNDKKENQRPPHETKSSDEHVRAGASEVLT